VISVSFADLCAKGVLAADRWFTNPTISLAKLTAHQTQKGSAVNSVPGHPVFNLSLAHLWSIDPTDG